MTPKMDCYRVGAVANVYNDLVIPNPVAFTVVRLTLANEAPP